LDFLRTRRKENAGKVKTILKCWILIALIVTGLSWLPFILIQQDIRSSANDPQIQMAEDIAAKLAAGQSMQSLVPAEQVDITRSLATYVIIFDDTGTALASSGQINGQAPTLPTGVFAYVRQNGEDRITWQPQSGVRSAIVVTQFKGASSGFVLVGRSLREVEIREDNLEHLTLFGWLSILIVSFLASVLLFGLPRSRARLS
jgi:hypothetical protein